jgi:uncharacterized protein
MSKSAISWFEIPTTDFERATRFYETLLDVKLQRIPVDELHNMFPAEEGGVRGSVVHRPSQKPTGDGSLVYLNADGKLEASLKRAEQLGATILVPRTVIPGTWTLVAWCEMRNDFRTFRLDRVAHLQQLDRVFEQRRGQRLSDYLKRVHAKVATPNATNFHLAISSPMRSLKVTKAKRSNGMKNVHLGTYTIAVNYRLDCGMRPNLGSRPRIRSHTSMASFSKSPLSLGMRSQ